MIRLTWQRCGAGELRGQLELCGVSLHRSCDEQLKGPLEETRRWRWKCGTLYLCTLNIVLGLGGLLLPVILLLRGSRGGGCIGSGRAWSAARSTAGPAVQETHLRHT